MKLYDSLREQCEAAAYSVADEYDLHLKRTIAGESFVKGFRKACELIEPRIAELEKERDRAVRAMNDAHESLRKAGEYWKEADKLRAEVEQLKVITESYRAILLKFTDINMAREDFDSIVKEAREVLEGNKNEG